MDEDVDDEALQAQVDRSLGKVNEIVAGWMKPFKGNVEANKMQEMVEKDIEFYSSRPPHLGVGVVYEPAKGDARDVACLKGRLVQRKRDTDEGPSNAVNQVGSGGEDDDEDSRAKTFTKKTNAQQKAVDKFSTKAKRKAAASNSVPIQSGAKAEKSDKIIVGQEDKSIDDSSSTLVPSSIDTNDHLTNGISRASTSASISSPTSASMPPPAITAKLQTPKVNNDAHHANNVFSPQRTLTIPNGPLLFKQPNFGDPYADRRDQEESDVGDDDRDDAGIDTTAEADSVAAGQTQSPIAHKRKRKRRKKKHQPASNADAETQLNPASASPSSSTLQLQIPKPTVSPSSRADSITPSESVASLATGPPPTISTLSSRATSPGSIAGAGSSQEKGLVLGPATEEDVRSSPKLSKISNILSPRKKSGLSDRRKQLYAKIAAKERKNALLREMEEANSDS